MKKHILIVSFFVLGAFLYPRNVLAATSEAEMPFALQSRSAAVLDLATGEFAQTYNADEVMPIASLTKLMTALVFLDTQPNWGKRIAYSNADSRIGAKLLIRAGDTITIRQLFNTMLIGSANNATITLVRSTGLTQAEFVRRMNAKAALFGLKQTHFVEPTGLDDGNVSTAREYAYLAKLAFGNAKIQKVTTTPVYAFSTGGGIYHRIKNSNTLLKNASLRIRGGKTGYTEEAGFSVAMITQARPNSTASYITVVLGHPSSAGRFAEARELATFAATL